MLKKFAFLVLFLPLVIMVRGQITIPDEYYMWSQKADSLLAVGDFKNAALYYTRAFNTIGGKGIPIDRYNAAQAWAQCNYPDSAFENLVRIAEKTSYANYYHITHDSALNILHKDKRWQPLLDTIRQNKQRLEYGYSSDINQLDSIFIYDQMYREMMDSITVAYGRNSSEMNDLLGKMIETDRVNLIKVQLILEKHGWPDSTMASERARTAIFLVIQHTSDLQTQLDYLPAMREAVKAGIAKGEELALLEDRIALRQGKKQLYGSQVRRNKTTGTFYVAPIEDEPNVNKRRQQVGLPPLEEYLKHWGIEYKLPEK